MAYKFRQNQRGGKRRKVFGVSASLVLIAAAILAGCAWYAQALRPVSAVSQAKDFSIPEGTGLKGVAESLQSKGLVRSAIATEVYAHLHGASAKIQAGSYAIAPNESTPAIIGKLTQGVTASKLVTILPGKRIDEVRASLINEGFSPEAVDAALNPAVYADVPILAIKPLDVNSLEGLLWPDSFSRDDTTTPADIIRQSLEETSNYLTADVQAKLSAQGLTPYQGLILASIVTKEVGNTDDQPQVAQVFLKRLRGGIMLGSDVTAYYGAAIAGRSPSVAYDSAYNTRIRTGYPPTPISTVTQSALQAVANPAPTDWLFFVAGDDGVTHFSRTLAEHEKLTQQYCKKLCAE